jgi:hypothetical protein
MGMRMLCVFPDVRFGALCRFKLLILLYLVSHMRKALMISVMLAGLDARAGPMEELIVEVPGLSEWSVFKIRRQLLCLDGLHFSGYDVASSCLLLKIDPLRISSPALVVEVLKGLNKQQKFKLIKGYSIYQVIDGQMKPVSPVKKVKK